MKIDNLIVSFIGLGLVVFIHWFFFGKKEKVTQMGDKIEIKVSGGYNPSVIKIKKGQTTTLSLIRTDENTCLEEFVLWDFKIKKYLPLNQKVDIQITPDKKGEFVFSCGMNMFHGKVIVV